MRKNLTIFLYTLFAFGIGSIFLLLVLTALDTFGKLPSVKELENPQGDLATQVIGSDGSLIGKFYIKDRLPVNYKDISPNLVQALIATEDERFFSHSGIDFRSLFRAIFGVLIFNPKGGGSTISQQLAHNLLAEMDENYTRSRNPFVRAYQKLKEWIVAIRLEKNFTKEEIISYYFNTVPFGQNIYGIKNACYTFFKKKPKDVEVHQAALLIGMLKGNTIYNPVRNPLAALKRRNVVIDQIQKNDYITEQKAKYEKNQGLNLDYQKLDELSGLATHFRELLRKEIKEIISRLRKENGEPYNIYKDGLKIYTTIDPVLQNHAEKSFRKQMHYLQSVYFSNKRNTLETGVWDTFSYIIKNAIKRTNRWRELEKQGYADEYIYEKLSKPIPIEIYDWKTNSIKDTIMSPIDSIKYHKQIIQGGLLAIDPLTGKVKAWIGGNNFKFFKYDHVNINTKRQIGSAIKPLLYALAMTDLGFNSKTLCPNTSQCFPEFKNWCSHNDKFKQSESITLERGLIHSYNNVSAYLLKLLGPKRFAEFLKQCNISSKIPYVPSICMGTPEISLFEAVWAYSMFPNEGFSVKPYFIEKIESKDGTTIASFLSEKKQIINEKDAYTIVNILRKATHYGTSYQLRKKFEINYDIAGKTGTTNANSDAWFIGFTPQLLCGVWIGFDDKFISLKSNQGYGSRAAMPIFAEFFQSVYSNHNLIEYDKTKRFKTPFNIKTEINETGKKEKKRNKRLERFKKKRRDIRFDQ